MIWSWKHRDHHQGISLIENLGILIKTNSLLISLLTFRVVILSVISTLVYSLYWTHMHQWEHVRSLTAIISLGIINGEIAVARRELRRRERQGCKDFRIYRNKFCNLLHFTKRQFYKRSIQTITESKNNIKALYKITDSLIGKDKKLVLPSCASDITLCEDFSNFFTDKVLQMHTQMDIG